MKIIVNQNKELRAVGYDEIQGCNPLEIDFYISKSLNPTKPIHCIINNRYHLLMSKKEENDNYCIYTVLKLIDIEYEEGYKNIFISFNNIETKSLNLFFKSLSHKALSNLLERRI